MRRRSFVAGAVRGGIAAILSTGVAPALVRAAVGSREGEKNLIYKSATELAGMIRAKSISAEELTRAYLARISEVNGKLSAVCQIDEKGALETARAADVAVAKGDKLGKLHGVPITIKDSFDTKGIVSAAGTEGRRAFVPEKDATVVARLRTAGAIILGKTNTPELTLSYDTDNLVYGRTRNPYDLARTPGGSSGGAAAILAVGGSALDIGSDTAGSIRIPAHFCGIAGLKPTIGRVSRAGHILGGGGLVGRRTHVGPMARFVEDLILTLPIISGPDSEDPDVASAALENPERVDIAALRVAYFSDTAKRRANPEMTLAVRAATKALTDAGVKCSPARPPGIESAGELHAALNSADGGEYFEKVLKECGTTKLFPQTADFLKQMRSGDASKRKEAEVVSEWEKLRASNLEFMRDFEIVICPPCSDPAPMPGGLGFLDFSYASFFNLLGWPAAVVRVGRAASGLPKGVQIVGRPWKEHEVLAVALHLEKKLGGWKKDFREEALVESKKI